MPPATLALPNGIAVPTLGQGTWNLGVNASRRKVEMDAIRHGIERGLRLIDTAEMYGDGATETFLGEALAGLREDVFLVSKVYPQNAGGARLVQACEGSLRRLKTDRLDLYLLHWRGGIPLGETVAGLQSLQQTGKIGAWGVSNFDVADMDELMTEGGSACAMNQVLYNLMRRGPDIDLCPWLAERHIPLMAYSPIEQGRLRDHPSLANIAGRHGVSPAQVALAWLLGQPNVIAIPKASMRPHVDENADAAALVLTSVDRFELDRAFPPPRRKVPLQML